MAVSLNESALEDKHMELEKKHMELEKNELRMKERLAEKDILLT